MKSRFHLSNPRKLQDFALSPYGQSLRPWIKYYLDLTCAHPNSTSFWSIELLNHCALHLSYMHADLEDRSPFKFEVQTRKMRAIDYHLQVAQTLKIPLKVNTDHDLLNALMWCTFPASRQRSLYAIHHAYTHRDSHTPQKRTRLEDDLTLFDESGVLLISDQEDLFRFIQNRDWISFFLDSRSLLKKHFQCLLFGHGLAEQLIHPFLGLVGYGILIKVPSSYFQLSLNEQLRYLDPLITQRIYGWSHSSFLSAQKRIPLHAFPCLGLPNWWKEEQNLEFYQKHSRYFRGPYEQGRKVDLF